MGGIVRDAGLTVEEFRQAIVTKTQYDAVVVGSGPNGLAAAVALARAGRSVLVLEAAATPGGGCRTAELTLPGFLHDVCSAVHPLGLASPFFRRLPLAEYGLEWIQPPAPLAHPFDDGTAAMLERSIAATAAELGPDAAATGPDRPAGARLGRTVLRRCARRCACRATRSGWRGSGCRPSARRAGWRTTRFQGSRPARCSRAWRPIPCCRWSSRRRRVRAGARHRRPRRRLADPARRLAAHRRRAGVAICARWAASRSATAPVDSLDELPPHGPSSRRDAAPGAADRRGPPAARLPAQLERYRYGPGAFKLD